MDENVSWISKQCGNAHHFPFPLPRTQHSCPDVAYYEETFNATKSCGAQNAVTNGETNLGCSLPFKESACYLSTLPPNALYGLSGIQNTPTWRKIIFRIPLTPVRAASLAPVTMRTPPLAAVLPETFAKIILLHDPPLN